MRDLNSKEFEDFRGLYDSIVEKKTKTELLDIVWELLLERYVEALDYEEWKYSDNKAGEQNV